MRRLSTASTHLPCEWRFLLSLCALTAEVWCRHRRHDLMVVVCLLFGYVLQCEMYGLS